MSSMGVDWFRVRNLQISPLVQCDLVVYTIMYNASHCFLYLHVHLRLSPTGSADGWMKTDTHHLGCAEQSC